MIEKVNMNIKQKIEHATSV